MTLKVEGVVNSGKETLCRSLKLARIEVAGLRFHEMRGQVLDLTRQRQIWDV
jgi:hypothetical protein